MRNNAEEYALTRELYQATIWFIRDYPRRLEEYRDVIQRSRDGGGGGGFIGRPTEADAIKLEAISTRYLDPVEKAMGRVPEELQSEIWNSIIWRIPFSHDTARCKKWKRAFVWFVAHERGDI